MQVLLYQVVKTSADPNYQFGDISKAAANEVVEWGKRERKALESVTGVVDALC
jgi:hypothetical protein